MDPTAAFNAGIPALGTWVLYAFLVAAAVAFGLSVTAATQPPQTAPRYLRAARFAALGTCALVALDVLLLLYAFVSHDFRIRYVMRYSDRSMPTVYLFTALWGGQDGSLLWWTFLIAAYSGACVLWMRGRYRELAPYVIATLMTVLMFFGVLMAFAANPFGANVAGAPPDGEGLNPSLQNFYMAIHPPSLYVGFVGCTVPFAFAIAALCTGRLDEEWIGAARRWALFAWLFLSIGNTLGMLWAYEELGWGGFWAWDPVENAACIPWWTTTAFLHSVMIQERRGTLKVWNVSLIITSFVLTLFGTFLTRSGLISSIHSFAQSEIGVYFLYFIALVLIVSIVLIGTRLEKLGKPMEVESVLSREAMFVVNNWMLLLVSLFIVFWTLWPKIVEWLWHDRSTVGANFYNAWLPPLAGVPILTVMGIGTLTPWRKGSGALLLRAFRVPVAVGVTVALAHVVFGRALGYAPYVQLDPVNDGALSRALAKLDGGLAPVFTGLIAYNLSAIVQEYWRGTTARARAKDENFAQALFNLVGRNRRRYGGYIVHTGFLLMVLGWTGTYWKSEADVSLSPHQTMTVGRYTLRYDSVEMRRDPNKRMVFLHMTAFANGREYAHPDPAKFIYTTHQDSPTSEVSITPSLREDLYVVMASVNPTTHVAHIKAFVNPLTIWIWLGCLVIIFGTSIAIWPDLSFEFLRGPARDGGDGPTGGAIARRAALLAVVSAGGALLLRGGEARAQMAHTFSSPPPVGGESEQMTPTEHRLFGRLLCMCGGCQRLPLETCTCDVASSTRATLRARLHAGESPEAIVRAYLAQWGPAALAVPNDTGHNKIIYALPVVLAGLTGGAAAVLVHRWRSRSKAPRVVAVAGPAPVPETAEQKSTYDRRLDEELRDLDR